MGRKSGSIKEDGGPLEAPRLMKVRSSLPLKPGLVSAPRFGAFTSKTAKANQRRRVLQRKPLRVRGPPEREATLQEKKLLRGGIDGIVASVNGAGWRLALNDELLRCFVSYREGAFSKAQTKDWWTQLETEINWTQPMVGERQLPRSAAWLTKKGCKCVYKYGQTQWPAQPMEDWFLDITEKVCRACGLKERPNSCNANYYLDGSQQVGWHTDDEPLFDGTHRDTLIVSLSLGTGRTFELSNNYNRAITKIGLKDGDICTMEGMLQKHYKHRVPCEPGVQGGRINLTWRWIMAHDVDCPAGNEQPTGSPSPVPGRQEAPGTLPAPPDPPARRSGRRLEDLPEPPPSRRKRKRFENDGLRVRRSEPHLPEPAMPAPVQMVNKEESKKRWQEVANFKTAIGSLGTVASGRRPELGNLPREMRPARAKEARPRRKENLESAFERPRFRRAAEDKLRSHPAGAHRDLDPAQERERPEHVRERDQRERPEHVRARDGDLQVERGREKREPSANRRNAFENRRDQRREREQDDVDDRHLRRRARERAGHDRREDRESAHDLQHNRSARHGRGCERQRDISRERRRPPREHLDREELDIRHDRENDRGRREREDIQGLVNDRNARRGQMQDREQVDFNERHRILEEQRLRRRSDRHLDCERVLENNRERADSQSFRHSKPLAICDHSAERHRDRERRREKQLELEDVVERPDRHRTPRDREDRSRLAGRPEREYDRGPEAIEDRSRFRGRHERENDRGLGAIDMKERGHRARPLALEDAKDAHNGRYRHGSERERQDLTDERDDRDRRDSQCERQEVETRRARRLGRREPHEGDVGSPAFDVHSPAIDVRSPVLDVRSPTVETFEPAVLKERRSSHGDSKLARPKSIDEPDLNSSARCRGSTRRVYRERSRSRSQSFQHLGYRGRDRHQDNSSDGHFGKYEQRDQSPNAGRDADHFARLHRTSHRDWKRDDTMEEDHDLVQSHRSKRHRQMEPRSKDEQQVQDKQIEKEDDFTAEPAGKAEEIESRPIVEEKQPLEQRATSAEEGHASLTEEEKKKRRAERFGLSQPLAQPATNRSPPPKRAPTPPPKRAPTPPPPPSKEASSKDAPSKETEADRRQKRWERFNA